MKKIAVIGPESTGKSTLCAQLADHFHSQWVPEYAREYLLEHGTSYQFNDLLTIAKHQAAIEDSFVNNARGGLLLLDTNMYVMKVWCEFVFSRCHHWILEEIVTREYDVYLLCNPDLPWVADELREYPDLHSRLVLYHMYRDILVNQHVPWTEIRGEPDQRFTTAVAAISSLTQPQ